MKKIIVIVIIAMLTACGGRGKTKPNKIDNTGWGVSRLTQAQKTDSKWLDSFIRAIVISVTSTIDDALDFCPKNDYCTLEIDKLALSDTVYITRSKTKLIGKQGNKISYLISAGESGVFFVVEDNIKDVIFEGLNLDGESTNYGKESIHGFFIKGKNIKNLALLKNHVHHFYSDDDSHGIAVYGTGKSEKSAIENIIIDGNNIHNMKTGASESIVVNGNVKRWTISNNTISHINNIVIDAIGGEGTSPVQIIKGRVLSGKFDTARYGVIEGNNISDMSTETNLSYDNEHSWAGGIYIDGAQYVYITNNTVSQSEWAYDIGAENCVEYSFIFMEKNKAENSYFGDFYAGGYRKSGYKENKKINCNPNITTDDIEGHGYVKNITVKNNQFVTKLPRVSTVQLENRVRKSIIMHAGVNATHTDGKVVADENSIRVTE